MKWVVSALIVGCCFYIGFGVANFYKKRESLFTELGIFCGKLKSDIKFSSKPLKEILSEVIPTLKSPLKDILQKYLSMIVSGEFTDFNNVSKKISSVYLKDGEAEVIVQFLSMLGKSDCDNENETISAFEIRFNEFKNECFKDKKKYSSMYLKLSVLLGLFVCVMLI